MSMHFREHVVEVPSTVGKFEIQESETFPGPVVSAGTALNGFRLKYTGDNLLLARVEVDTDRLVIDDDVVNFRVQCNLADDSANDPYEGYVTISVMAEL